MMTITVTIIGFIGLVTTLTLIQLQKYASRIQLSALSGAGLLFLALTTFGLYELMDSQTLQFGVICGALVIFLKNVQLVKRRYTTLTTGGDS